MRGYIGVTDRDWACFLKGHQDAGRSFEEINFWRPSDRAFKSLKSGEPFLFRLKSPDNAIGGVGFFERFSSLPVWLAWEAFGAANGVPSLADFEARLRAIRGRNKIGQVGDPPIGCILLAQPVFFERDEWVRLPADWGPRTQSGASYDLEAGEGARVWRECSERLMQRGVRLIEDAPGRADPGADRFGRPTMVRPRLGQGGFRIAVMEAYRRQCAVTTEHSLPVLEAAHIQPYSEGGGHAVQNGLLLRSDIHRLYDRGYVTVTANYRFRVSRRLHADFANGKAYYALDDQALALPECRDEWPDARALAWHAESRFLG